MSLSEQQKGLIAAEITNTHSQQYLTAYLSAVGANIHLGEKSARKRGREAGCCAMKFAETDLLLDAKAFSAACQASFENAMEQIMAAAEAEAEPQVLVAPANILNSNGKLVN